MNFAHHSVIIFCFDLQSSIIRHRIAEFFLYGFQLVFQLFDLFEEIEASIIIVVTKNIAVIRGLFFFHLQCSFDVILLPENLGLVFYFFMQMRVLVSFFILNHRAVVSCWVDLESRYGCAHRHVALVKDVLLSSQSIFFCRLQPRVTVICRLDILCDIEHGKKIDALREELGKSLRDEPAITPVLTNATTLKSGSTLSKITRLSEPWLIKSNRGIVSLGRSVP